MPHRSRRGLFGTLQRASHYDGRLHHL